MRAADPTIKSRRWPRVSTPLFHPFVSLLLHNSIDTNAVNRVTLSKPHQQFSRLYFKKTFCRFLSPFLLIPDFLFYNFITDIMGQNSMTVHISTKKPLFKEHEIKSITSVIADKTRGKPACIKVRVDRTIKK